MKISYNWLQQYLSFDLTPQELSVYLTDCGLEVENIETFESIKGGLRGLVVGEVITCEPHQDSDHLHLTTVDIGEENLLNIVCGAPNVAKGQKVVVATIGTTLYSDDGSFTIKKSKIRGAVSEGMICAEDEIGVGNSHEGILVLPNETKVGTSAADYFKVETDTIFEIGLTPNRSDATSHYGVARDIYAVLKTNDIKCSTLHLPTVSEFSPYSKTRAIEIKVENRDACPRYIGLTVENLKIQESPLWLQNRLKSIGIRPINNIVDITQFVMFETGQPLHAFDLDKIAGNKVIIKNLPSGTPFVTLDGNEIKLDKEDLMICNANEAMCIAGVYGGLHFGVTEQTTSIFLESAYFNPVSIRKSAKRHQLKTDAAFRFERGADPEMALYAIKRAAILMKEYGGAVKTSDIIDFYPKQLRHAQINLRYEFVYQVIGKVIDKEIISSILLSLGMEVQAKGDDLLIVTVPFYKTDVTRPIDLVEEILRIYGYNNVEIPEQLTYPIRLATVSNIGKIKEKIALLLANSGFFEMMNNSLTKSAYSDKFEQIDKEQEVALLNPLSNDLKVLRQDMMFSGLESVIRNINNKNTNLRLFEFGNSYRRVVENKKLPVTEQYLEKEFLTLFVTGKSHEGLWNEEPKELDFFYLKNIVLNILKKVNCPVEKLMTTTEKSERFTDNLTYLVDEKQLVTLGRINTGILHYFDIKKPVYYAEIDVQLLYEESLKNNVKYAAISPYPSVKRDLALVVGSEVSYEQLEKIVYNYGSKLVKNVTLFDVYEGEKIEKGKKSYALNIILQRSDKTLTENEIQRVMQKIVTGIEKEVGGVLRK